MGYNKDDYKDLLDNLRNAEDGQEIIDIVYDFEDNNPDVPGDVWVDVAYTIRDWKEGRDK